MSLFNKSKYTPIVIMIFVIAIGILIYKVSFQKEILPVFNPTDFNPELVDISMQGLTENHRVADFDLTNQNGEIITQSNYENKIYVADFFFTTCQTICPIMTNHMYQIQKEIINDDDIMLLSHSVTPRIDSVTQLKKYAKEKGVIDRKWNLVTGDKKQIYKLARKSYLAVKTQGNGDKYDMIHTENFMLIDKKRQIRGFYDGTQPEDIKQLLEDLETLKDES